MRLAGGEGKLLDYFYYWKAVNQSREASAFLPHMKGENNQGGHGKCEHHMDHVKAGDEDDKQETERRPNPSLSVDAFIAHVPVNRSEADAAQEQGNVNHIIYGHHSGSGLDSIQQTTELG